MKTILALLLSAGLSAAQNSVTLEWDPNPAADSVAGYRVYQKVVTPPPVGFPGNPAPAVSWNLVGQTAGTVNTYTVSNVAPGTTTYALTAFNVAGESGRSNEATATIAAIPGIPGNFRVKIVTVTP